MNKLKYRARVYTGASNKLIMDCKLNCEGVSTLLSKLTGLNFSYQEQALYNRVVEQEIHIWPNHGTQYEILVGLA